MEPVTLEGWESRTIMALEAQRQEILRNAQQALADIGQAMEQHAHQFARSRKLAVQGKEFVFVPRPDGWVMMEKENQPDD